MKSVIKKLFILKLNLPMLLTFLGILFGIIATRFVLINDSKNALIFLCFAGICDAFDGTFANKFKRTEEEKQIGIQLDSLADIYISGIIPILIMLSMGFNNVIDIIIYFVFISFGVYRLSYYNISCEKDPKYFTGIPITTTTIVYPFLYLFTREEIYFVIATFILSLLFIGNFRFKKPNWVVRLIISLVGIAIISYVVIMKVKFI